MTPTAVTPTTDFRGSRVIHSARIVDGDGTIADNAWVRFEDGVVVARGTGSDWSDADDVIDAAAAAGPDALITPGFIDIHGHGGAVGIYQLLDHRGHEVPRAEAGEFVVPIDLLVHGDHGGDAVGQRLLDFRR